MPPPAWPGCAAKPTPGCAARAVHPPSRAGIRLRDLCLLPHRHRVPAHPHPAARPRRDHGQTDRAALFDGLIQHRTELTAMPGITLDPVDAAELAEVLTFL